MRIPTTQQKKEKKCATRTQTAQVHNPKSKILRLPHFPNPKIILQKNQLSDIRKSSFPYSLTKFRPFYPSYLTQPPFKNTHKKYRSLTRVFQREQTSFCTLSSPPSPPPRQPLSNMKSTASSASSRPGGAAAPSGVRNRRPAPAGSSSVSAPKSNQNSLGLTFYGDDSAGTLKLGPVPILGLSFAYIILVIMLHALAKFTR